MDATAEVIKTVGVIDDMIVDAATPGAEAYFYMLIARKNKNYSHIALTKDGITFRWHEKHETKLRPEKYPFLESEKPVVRDTIELYVDEL